MLKQVFYCCAQAFPTIGVWNRLIASAGQLRLTKNRSSVGSFRLELTSGLSQLEVIVKLNLFLY